MSDNNVLGFLNQEEHVHLPTGGDFSPSGFIGKTYAAVLFSFYSKEAGENYEGFPKWEGRRKMGEGFRYYYKTMAEAKSATEMLGIEITPQNVWTFRIDRDTVLNFADASKLEAFSNPIAMDVNVMTMKSKKRHEFHMLALPLAVQAMAKLLGFEYEPFSINELLQQDVVYTDEFFARMCGAEKEYKDSILWSRRAALWASLGENDASVYQPIGSDKFATTSEKLSKCLQVVSATWKNQVWARVIQVKDPRVDASYDKGGETVRTSIPALYEIFRNEADAKAAAQVDIDRMAKKDGNGNGHTNGHNLEVPAEWKDLPDEWKAKVNELKASGINTASAPAKAKTARQLAVTVAELEAWTK